MTGLLAITFPVMLPSGKAVGVADGSIGVDVNVAVGDSTGVDDVGVAVSTGVSDVGVVVSTGVGSVPVGVGVSTDVSEVEVDVTVSTGVGSVPVGVGDSPGVDCVGVDVISNGVGVAVGVDASPTIVSVSPVDGMLVRRLSPLDTRAIHSIVVCPACKPVALKVKAAPLVVALLPLLPAIATMKLPFCGSLIATAGSGPKRLVAVMLLTCTSVEL